MPKKTKSQNQLEHKIYSRLALIVAAVLLILGSLSYWAHDFAATMVREELSAQKIYFPEKGSPNFSPETYPDLQQYAGQLVDDAPKARAYANGYIGRHLANVADGKVYAEVSAELMKNPDSA